VTAFEGAALDQDLVALRAGTVLPSRIDGPQVPPGASGFSDYRFELPLADPALSGTCAEGLAGAIELLSGGALKCVPMRGGWSAAIVSQLVSAAQGIDARLIANIRTGRLWGTRPPVELVLAWLDGREADVTAPAHEWDVGHFVELLTVARGRGRALVVVRDSYPTLGWDGHHLQPPDVVAAALLRGDGFGGGVLAVAPAARADDAIALGRELGLDIGMWDNGTRARR
jgi:hypothetical protein